MHDTMYHCADCVGQDKKFTDIDGELNHGFHLCKKCYDENPTFEINHHSKYHDLLQIDRNEMIHLCNMCQLYFCHDCLITSQSSISVLEYGEEDKFDEWVLSICKTCFTQFPI